MEIYIDPSDTDFVNNVAELSNFIGEMLADRETQIVEHNDCDVEAYAISCRNELDRYCFPESERDLEATASELGALLDAETWFEGDYLYIAS